MQSKNSEPEDEMKNRFDRLDKLIPWILMILFALIAVNNISWGTPRVWHPDELAIRVSKALNDDWEFDTINFDYPSLPKYVMYGVGNLAIKLGYADKTLESLRLISVILGGAIVALTYKLSRKVGSSPLLAFLAAALALTCSELVLNSSFAHNDIYLAFFITITAFAVIRYAESSNRIWLYVSFLLIGLATSSKYNGVSVILVPGLLFISKNYRDILKNWLRNLETIIISAVSFAAGYAIGTPKSATWFAFYAKNAIPAITNHAKYGWEPGAKNGFFTQWGTLNSALGLPLFILAMVSIVYITYRILKDWVASRSGNDQTKQFNQPVSVLLLILLAYDIPILFSYNVQPRFFTSTVPLLVILSALFVELIVDYINVKGIAWVNIAIVIFCIGILAYGGLRTSGVVLSFANDQRIPATEFVKGLEEGTKIEYTLYPPNVNKEQFYTAHNYPIQFLKFPDQEVPKNPFFDFNIGEVGVEDRKPDYLVIDSFTYARFSDEYICQRHAADCAFFEKLLAGEANYELIKVFEYDLPGFIPPVNVEFLNPDIRVYQRINP